MCIRDSYNSTHTFNNGASLVTIPGSTLSRPVNNYEYETQKNEKNREIYILQPALLEAFVSSFKKSNKYIESSDYINKNLKKTNRI